MLTSARAESLPVCQFRDGALRHDRYFLPEAAAAAEPEAGGRLRPVSRVETERKRQSRNQKV